jgi:lipid-binding SYLF domain-containing protein
MTVAFMAACLPAWAAQEAKDEFALPDPPVTCLGEQICADLPNESTLRSRGLAHEVLEAVYDLPEKEKRYFLDIRREARGFAIFPNIQKGGVLGARIFGRGILSFRDNQGDWSPPIILALEGQSVGPQFGAQSSNLIFIFKKICSLKDFLSEHHHISTSGLGVRVEHIDHTGPGEATDMMVHVFEHGMIMGQSIDRYMITIDKETNAALYGLDIKPGCMVEGVRTGLQRPWMLRYVEQLSLPDDKAHATYSAKDVPRHPGPDPTLRPGGHLGAGALQKPELPALPETSLKPERPPLPETPPKPGR